jgi:hypothetical protein
LGFRLIFDILLGDWYGFGLGSQGDDILAALEEGHSDYIIVGYPVDELLIVLEDVMLWLVKYVRTQLMPLRDK